MGEILTCTYSCQLISSMEGGLFAKYKVFFDTNKKEKEEILSLVKEKTKLTLKEKSVVIQKKELKFYLSSNERTIFIVRGGIQVLKEKGYKVSIS